MKVRLTVVNDLCIWLIIPIELISTSLKQPNITDKTEHQPRQRKYLPAISLSRSLGSSFLKWKVEKHNQKLINLALATQG
jgi:hypothetical protein